MDIFAMGCVIFELFTNNIAFTLPQAIDYKRMDERLAKQYLRKILSNVPNDFAELLEIMLDRDPVRRKEEFAKVGLGFNGVKYKQSLVLSLHLKFIPSHF